MLSHGLVRDWDPEWPVSISPAAIGRLRHAVPGLLLMSDDLQMEALRRCCSLEEACLQGARAGLDLLCIGNNLRYEEAAAPAAATAVAREVDAQVVAGAIARVRERKLAASG